MLLHDRDRDSQYSNIFSRAIPNKWCDFEFLRSWFSPSYKILSLNANKDCGNRFFFSLENFNWSGMKIGDRFQIEFFYIFLCWMVSSNGFTKKIPEQENIMWRFQFNWVFNDIWGIQKDTLRSLAISPAKWQRRRDIVSIISLRNVHFFHAISWVFARWFSKAWYRKLFNYENQSPTVLRENLN